MFTELNRLSQYLHQYCIPQIVALLFLMPAVMYYAINSSYQVDEFQHLHIKWYLKEGYSLYKDCFDHHGIIFPLLGSYVWKIFNISDDVSAFSAFRYFIVTLNGILGLTMLYLSQRYYRVSTAASALVILLLSEAFTGTAFQIRPAILIGTLAFCCVILALNSSSKRGYLLQGILWAIGILTSIKVVLPLTFTMLFLLLKRGSGLRHVLHSLIPMFVILFLFLGWGYYSGTLDLIYRFAIEDNLLGISHYLKYVPIYFPYDLSFNQMIAVVVIILLASLASYRRKIRDITNMRFVGLMLITLLTCAVTVLLRRYLHWSVLYLPLLAFALAHFVHTFLCSWKYGAIANIIVLSLLIHVAIGRADDLKQRPDHDLRQLQIRNTQSELELIPEKHMVLFVWNGNYRMGIPRSGGYIFRKHFLFHWQTDLGLGPKLSPARIEEVDNYFEYELRTRVDDNFTITMCPHVLSNFKFLSAFVQQRFKNFPGRRCIFQAIELAKEKK